MEVQNKSEEPATLEAGLDFWGRQEQKFQSLFGQEALKDKEFLKMKLRYYDSLWYKYKNAPLSLEGQLMRNMLKFQRRKIEKSRHRGLLRRIIRRINTAVEARWVQKAQRRAENRSLLEHYNERSLKPQIHALLKETATRQKTAGQAEQSTKDYQSEKTRQRKFYGYNYNQTAKRKQKVSKGLRP